MHPTYRLFLNKVENMRKLQKSADKCQSSTQKAGIIRECKPVADQVDSLITEVRSIMDAEQLKLF